MAFLIIPNMALAATPLHNEEPGTVITFSGKQWVILKQMPDGTTYILLNSNVGNRAFDTDNTQLFNPSDSNNIGYYLNNTFYNSLSQKDLILEHSWDIRAENGTVKGGISHVTAKIGLISYSEYSTYSGNVLPQEGTGYYWWTITPYSGNSANVYSVFTNGVLVNYGASISRGVRPALYLKSGILVSETKEVIGIGDIDTTPPAVPSGLKGHAVSDTKIQLNWNQNTESDLAGYKIYRNGLKVDEVGTNSYLDTGLSEYTTYSYQVSSFDTSGNESAKSAAIQVTTNETPVEPPDAPTGLNGVATGPNTVELTWEESTDPDVTSYNVYRDGVKIGGTAINSFLDDGLDPETSYVYEITAVSVKGVESEKSAPITITTLTEPLPPPSPPGGLKVGHITDVTARFEWKPVDNAQEYKVYLNGFLKGNTNQPFYDFTDLRSETSYIITVTAIVGDQESEQAEPIEFTTLATPTSPPAKPVLSARSIIGTGSVNLSWSLDDPTITKWEVYMNDSLIDELPGDCSGIKISDLEEGEYSFKIRAINSAGISDYSDTVTVSVTKFSGFISDIADIFAIIGKLILAMWPLLAFGLALIVIPRIIRILYTALAARR